MSTRIEEAAARNWQWAIREIAILDAGWQLRDASFDDVEHYFIYHADAHAEHYLG